MEYLVKATEYEPDLSAGVRGYRGEAIVHHRVVSLTEVHYLAYDVRVQPHAFPCSSIDIESIVIYSVLLYIQVV